jgi:hypothetical protein
MTLCGMRDPWSRHGPLLLNQLSSHEGAIRLMGKLASFPDQLADAARSMQGWASTQSTLNRSFW